MSTGFRRSQLAAIAPPVPLRRRAEAKATAPRREPGDALFAFYCVLAIIPLTAIAHHAVFYPTTCMLNPFGPDYSPAVLSRWLTRDPSLLFAILLFLGIHRAGNLYPSLRHLVPAFVIAFLPLSLWIWDIPFTGRYICAHFHDFHVMLTDDVSLRSRHFYLLGALLFAGQVGFRGLRTRREQALERLATT
jgi:hypothetical protein